MFGLCYGPAPVQVEINSHSIGAITYDSHTHQLLVPAADLHAHGQWVHVAAPQLDAWALDWGTIR